MAQDRALAFLVILVIAISSAASAQTLEPLATVRGIIDAVNARDADAYVAGVAPDVQVRLFDGETRVVGREALLVNRRAHFDRHPTVRAEIVHLVQIDDRVIMHDRVWLDASTNDPRDIVEVFTFGGGLIVRIDVIQPADLFQRPVPDR